MKKLSLYLASLFVLSACMSPEQRAANFAENERANRDLQDSYKNSRVSCANKTQCDKAFSITKVFVQEYSDMRVQISDDTLVSTYGPIDYGRVAMRATKTPSNGDSSTIDLIVTCKGMTMENNNYFSALCKKRVTSINNQYRDYVDSVLSNKTPTQKTSLPTW